MFTCLDNVVPPPSSAPLRTFESSNSSESPPSGGKNRWKMLKSMFTGPTNDKPGEVTPPGSGSEDQSELKETEGSESNNQQVAAGNEEETQKEKPHIQYTFRFSLEFAERKWPSKNRKLSRPRLPVPAQIFLQSFREREVEHSDSASGSISNSVSVIGSDDESETDDTHVNDGTKSNPLVSTPAHTAGKPDPPHVLRTSKITSQNLATPVASKYAGRALAEWAQVVVECNKFFERRRLEGVPSDELVETPTLSVDSFRK